MTRLMRSTLLGLALAQAVACGAPPPSEEPSLGEGAVAVAPGAPLSFAYTTLDGRAVSSARYRDRMTVIALAATYDTASQAQARFVNSVYQRHAPRINALLLVLEPADHLPLAEAFVQSLDLRYDAALADADTIAGKGLFPGLHHVPSIVLLDRDGREVWRQLGVVDAATLTEVLKKYQ